MNKLWEFTGSFGSFKSDSADKIRSLYLPLCNNSLMSSISPDLHGDIKTGHNSFLLEPVSRIDLSASRSSRNFWISKDKAYAWSATGVSKNLSQINEDKFCLEAGLLWQETSRENKRVGLKAQILSFVPCGDEPVEIMRIKLTNISKRSISFIPTAAIPMYCRGANNIRDHRHVTSLLQRIKLHRFGVIAKPTLSFDESGHKINKNYYFVLGWEGSGKAPQYIYPTQEGFCGDSGDLEAPEAILENKLPGKRGIQGKEPMGGLRFRSIKLAPGESRSYIILMGITEDVRVIARVIRKFRTVDRVRISLEETKRFWREKSKAINIDFKDSSFDNWFRWVSIQPVLRKIFGCSFLPDFDYGKGGRGWRDLWQDCLGLILSGSGSVRNLLINNFSGVRIDGSNATIIGNRSGEFIADRNDIPRVWMDHGVWPLITTELYIRQTRDLGILFEEVGYFCDQHVWRSSKINRSWSAKEGNKLKTSSGKEYRGTIFEHLLVQNLAQFFNVGEHNHIRLEGADWNDGLDMANKRGESVAFSAMYAKNLIRLADLLLGSGKRTVKIAKELLILLKHFDYGDTTQKRRILEEYFTKVENRISGKKIVVDAETLARSLKVKSMWITQHIRENEWLREGFFNGYYDNKGKRVEGRVKAKIRMMLASQVFAIMSGVAQDWQVKKIISSVDKYLFDTGLGGYRLNTDFKDEQHDLGRAFSFSYGEKENGAIFSHMVVMYAYALFSRGFSREGEKVLSSLYKLATNTQKSKVYPCLPEYFNSEGRGMYSYLTGSASWFILTLFQFGAKGIC